VVADRDAFYIDEEANALKLEAVEKLTPPVFKVNDEITAGALERFDEFRETFLRILGEDLGLDQIVLRLQLFFPGSISRAQVAELSGNPVVGELFDDARDLLVREMERGVVGLSQEQERLTWGSRSIEVWRWVEGKLIREELQLGAIVTMSGILERLALLSANGSGRSSDSRAELVTQLAASFVRENTFLDEQETERAVETAKAEVAPEILRIVEGQVIVRKGDIVSDEANAQIRALGVYTVTVHANTLIGSALLLLILLALCVYLFSGEIVVAQPQAREVALLSAATVVYALAAAIAYQAMPQGSDLPVAVFLPTATFAILVALLMSPGSGVVFTLCASTLLLVVTGLDVNSFVFALATGIAGVSVVSRSRTRIDLIRAGVSLAVLGVPVTSAIGFMANAEPGWFVRAGGVAVANGFFTGILALGFLPILEHILNSASRFRLMELSDLNSPVLKRMLTTAPGTYNHSINVANLAEFACVDMGANHLLARVGAYYHDIGKLDQPEYFIENQTDGNKHDDLNPSLSVAVIKSHVKVGVEKGRELALPREVIDIIAQHHGKDLIKYFYHRAVSAGGAKNVAERDYSHQGERPRSREAAAVMIADAVEAVARTLKKPSVAKLEKLVWGVIMERFDSGELGESDLTFRDLEIIKSSFVQVLAGYYHTRIEYPRGAERSPQGAERSPKGAAK